MEIPDWEIETLDFSSSGGKVIPSKLGHSACLLDLFEHSAYP